MRRFLPISICVLLTFCTIALSADWPGWRGPNRDGHSADEDLLKRWPTSGPPLAWQTNTCGAGWGSPIVVDGKVFLMGNGRSKEYMVALDEETGEQVWGCVIGDAKIALGFEGPRSTPTYADGLVYGVGLNGRVICLDADSGKPIWYREMRRDFGGRPPAFGYCESVLVDDGKVLCTPGLQNTVAALDAKTGKTLWTAKVGDKASYSSIIKTEAGDVKTYVAFTEKGLIGLRASDGALLWRYDAPSNGQANIPTPVTLGATVFAASGYGKGGGCVWIKKDEEGRFVPEEIYFTNKMQSMYGGYLIDDNHLYGCSDPGVLVCMNYKTGKVVKVVRSGRGSLAMADGMIYFRGEDGKVVLYTASPTSMVATGTFEQPEASDKKKFPHPVIANGRLYLRDQYTLFAYDVAANREKPKPPASSGGSSERPSTGGSTSPSTGSGSPVGPGPSDPGSTGPGPSLPPGPGPALPPGPGPGLPPVEGETPKFVPRG